MQSGNLKQKTVVKEALECFQGLFVLDYNCSRIETLTQFNNYTKLHGSWYHGGKTGRVHTSLSLQIVFSFGESSLLAFHTHLVKVSVLWGYEIFQPCKNNSYLALRLFL